MAPSAADLVADRSAKKRCLVCYCRGNILKPKGACSRKYDSSRKDRWESGMWKSWDKESETDFFSPGNNWLYRLLSDSNSKVASFQAVASWMASSILSAKLVLRNHSEAEELSVWLSRQDSGSSTPWKISTHIFMMQAMNSKEFIDARYRQSAGSLKRQATPEVKL